MFLIKPHYFYSCILLILITISSCSIFGNVPPHFERSVWNTVEQDNKIYIFKEVNKYRESKVDMCSDFTMDTYKKLKYDNKIIITDNTIKSLRINGIILNIPAEYYVKEMDMVMIKLSTSKDKVWLKNMSIGILFHTIAAMDGDWNNGEDKLAHAIKWMGLDIFQEYKRLFPTKYNKLLSSLVRYNLLCRLTTG